MVSTNVEFELFFAKLSGIDPYEKCIDYLGGHARGHVFMACSKLEAMTIYLVKHACGNDILASVYSLLCPFKRMGFQGAYKLVSKALRKMSYRFIRSSTQFSDIVAQLIMGKVCLPSFFRQMVVHKYKTRQ